MSTICFNSARYVRGWFELLAGVQDRMAQINHLTSTNTKEFSQQKMGALLLPKKPGYDLRVNNLKQYCQQTLGLLVPDDGVKDDQSFLWFLGRISVPVEKRLLRLITCVAEKFGVPGIPLDSEAKFSKLSLAQVFHDKPYDENDGFKALDSLLRESLNPAFYRGATLFEDRTKLIKDVLRMIAN